MNARDSSRFMHYDVNKKLSDMLRENVVYKYTKSEKKTYQELLEYTIDLEIKNNEFERKIENCKKEIFMSHQTAIDLGLELDESRMTISHLTHQLKMKEKTFKFSQGSKETDAIDNFVNRNENSVKKNRKNTQSQRTNRTSKQPEMDESSSDNINLSLTNSSLDEVSIDNDIIHTLKKKKKNEKNLESENKRLENDNQNLMDDLNLLISEVKNLKSNIDEKDKIISILYQEVGNLKNSPCDQAMEEYEKNKIECFAEFSNSHYENLDSIKQSLVEFIKYYGIKEDFSSIGTTTSNNSIEYLIEIRMKEIKYILVNLKKINIIFKTLFMEYSKNLINTFQLEYSSTLNSKLEKMQSKIQRLSLIVERIYKNNMMK
jgi:hypothetical protein